MGVTETSDELYEAVGERIAHARRARGLTQDALAAEVSLTRTSITNIERGRQRVPLHVLWVIATALHVSPVSLLPVNVSQLHAARAAEALPGNLTHSERNWIRDVVARGRGEAHE